MSPMLWLMAATLGWAAAQELQAINGSLYLTPADQGDVVVRTAAGLVGFHALHEQLSTQASALEDAQATISTLVSEMAALRGAGLPARVSTLENAVPSAVASLETALRTELQSGSLSSGLSALQSSVVSSGSSVDIALSSLFAENLPSRVQNLEESAAGMQPQLSTLQSNFVSLADVPQNISELESRLDSMSGSGNLTALALQVASLQGDVARVLPFIVFQTNQAGRYDIGSIFDKARNDGLTAHLYECVLMTNNGAHWKGRAFKIIANHYTDSTHPGYPHRIFDEVVLDAGSSGCSSGLNSFTVTSDTGYFEFDPGNCFQTITLACRPPMF